MVKKIIIVFVVLLVAWGGFVFDKSYFENKKHPVAPPVPAVVQDSVVNVSKIESLPLVVSEKYVGFVLAIQSVEVRPFIEGFVDKVWVSGGDTVSNNEPLFQLEQGQYLAELDVQMANIMSATASFENAKTYYERLQAAGDNAVSKSDLDKARADFLTTGAAIGSAVAAYDAAQVMYNYTFVNAPIAGRLGNITVTKGQYVAPSGNALAYLVQESPVRVVFSISNEQYLKALENNPTAPFQDKKVRLKLADGQVYEQTGAVGFLDNQVTSATASVQVYADFENPNQALLPNSYVDVWVQENIPNAIVIPQRTATLKTNGVFVWTVDEKGLLQEKQITVAPQVIDNGFYLVQEGLKAGDFIVLQKSGTLKAGQSVQMKIEPAVLPKTYTATNAVKEP